MNDLRGFFRAVWAFCKKEPMLPAAVAAALLSFLLTPPSPALLGEVDWRTLVTLFLMLTVLEGFKKEGVFTPLLRLAGRIPSAPGLALFLVFGVFFTSMFVTNDVSLLIFVPLTILLFRAAGKERVILPLLAMENIAAVRGSLLTPFGSPQNLFIFGQSGVSAARFIGYMAPLCVLSGILLVFFVLFPFRKNLKEKVDLPADAFAEKPDPARRRLRILYPVLFAVILVMIVSRTPWYLPVAAAVIAALLIFDRRVFLKTDYVLLVTFLCFFLFSNGVAKNEAVGAFLSRAVAGREYFGSILVSQVISNVPAAIVLYPFAENRGALLYGLDSAGLVTLIGSLASVINYRLYVREYPGRGGAFIRAFTLISLLFFAFVVLPGFFLSQTPL